MGFTAGFVEPFNINYKREISNFDGVSFASFIKVFKLTWQLLEVRQLN